MTLTWNPDAIDTTTVACALCGVRLAVDPGNLSYQSATGHPHDPVTGEHRWDRP